MALLLSLSSFEFAVSFPITSFLYLFLILKKDISKSLKSTAPFILATVIYLIARLLYKQTPQIEDYIIRVDTDSLKSYFWYFLWSFNIPEEFKYQVTKLIILNPAFLSIFQKLAIKSYLGVLTLIVLGVFLPLVQLKKHQTKVNNRIVAFAILWFSVGISPVLFFPSHTFLMYLTLPSIGIYLLLAYLLKKNGSILLTVIFFGIFLYTTTTTIDFYKSYSYMNEAQFVSRKFTSEIKTKFPILPSEAIILYPLENPAHVQALSDQNAIRAIYNNQSLTIYYNKNQMLKALQKEKI